MKKLIVTAVVLILAVRCFCWGFFGHRKINYYACFLLPPQMLVFYKKHIDFISEHAVDPDKRRYTLAAEGTRHFIDIDRYGQFPYDSLPRDWKQAVEKYTEDTLVKYGIVPWWIQIMQARLIAAFKEKNQSKILKISSELGHYISDAHVPLHACSNHNGQFTNQRGIHGFWESRIPELLAETDWDFFIGKAAYINNPLKFIWGRVLESASAADSVLRLERELNQGFPGDQKFAMEERNGQLLRQYSATYTRKYNQLLNNMVERRMRQSIFAVASFWYSAWINAGQPDLKALTDTGFTEDDRKEWDHLNRLWKQGEACETDRHIKY